MEAFASEIAMQEKCQEAFDDLKALAREIPMLRNAWVAAASAASVRHVTRTHSLNVVMLSACYFQIPSYKLSRCMLRSP